MEILAFDVLLAGGLFIGLRWAWRGWERTVPLVAAVAAATAFVLIRDRYDLEDTRFLSALAAASAVAAAGAGAGSLPLTRRTRTATAYALLAAALVPALFAASIAVRYSACLVSGCDQS